MTIPAVPAPDAAGPLRCRRCDRDSGLAGTVSGRWTCGPCVAETEAVRKAEAVIETMNIRQEYRRGKRLPLIPGRVLPPEATDEEAQRAADEGYGVEWERREDKVIIWVEM